MGIAYGQVFGRKHNNQQPIYTKATAVENFLKARAARNLSEIPTCSTKRRCCRWEPEEIALVKDERIPFEEVARITGRTYKAVLSYASNHGYPSSPERFRDSGDRRKWTEFEDELIRDTSVKFDDIVKMTGHSRSSTLYRFQRLGVSKIGR